MTDWTEASVDRCLSLLMASGPQLAEWARPGVPWQLGAAASVRHLGAPTDRLAELLTLEVEAAELAPLVAVVADISETVFRRHASAWFWAAVAAVGRLHDEHPDGDEASDETVLSEASWSLKVEAVEAGLNVAAARMASSYELVIESCTARLAEEEADPELDDDAAAAARVVVQNMIDFAAARVGGLRADVTASFLGDLPAAVDVWFPDTTFVTTEEGGGEYVT